MIKSDPNDNVFQYALVDEAKNIWKDVFAGKLSPFYLVDSHNERWNEGFALSTYYSHLPQAAIALVGFLLPISTYQLFNLVKFLFLILLPLHFFISARVLKLSYLYAIILTIISQLVITDGLYGIDVTSFLWRGWGLSSQLMAVFFLPIAFAYSYSYLTDGKNLFKAVLANFLLAQVHSGIFFMLALSYPVISLSIVSGQWSVVSSKLSVLGKRFLIFVGLIGFSLSYYLIPFFLQADFRNFSYWDPIWKFNSWGIFPVLTYLLNGDLFDFGRLPVITYLTVFGVFIGFTTPIVPSLLRRGVKGEVDSSDQLFKTLSVLFIFYFLLFFGRTTWGGLIDLIPGFSEFHLHRFIVMVQFFGIYLASAMLLYFIERILVFVDKFKYEIRFVSLTLTVLTGLFLYIYMINPIVKYSSENARMIGSSNKIYEKDYPDYLKIVEKLKSLPKARVYAGRPGNWGRDFKIGDTPVYMGLSRDGFAGVGFPPESWSPNTEYDQFFDERNIDSFNLFNAGYIVAPDDFKPPDFSKLVDSIGKFRLYKVDTEGYFTVGTTHLRFTGTKTNFFNMTRFWMGSQFLKDKNFPTIDYSDNLDFGRKYKMLNLNNYQIEDQEKNIWVENPFILSKFTKKELDSIKNVVNYKMGAQSMDSQTFKTSVELKNDCKYCIVVLKQTYHPNWEVKVNGQKTNIFPVFPFYIGIPVNTTGEYTIEATYRPNGLKVTLVIIEVIFFLLFYFLNSRNRLSTRLRAR